MPSPPIHESQFVNMDVFEISSSSPSSSATSSIDHPEVLSPEASQSFRQTDADVQVNATQVFDGDDSLRSHIEDTQIDEELGIPWLVQEKSQTQTQPQSQNSAFGTSQATADRLRTAVATSLDEKPRIEPFQKSLSTSIENVGEDFMFTPGHYAKAKPIQKPPISISRGQSSHGIELQAPKIKIRSGSGRVSGTHISTSITHDHETTSSDTIMSDSHDDTGLKIHMPPETGAISNRLSLGDASVASKIKPLLEPISSRPKISVAKPPVPPFPGAALKVDHSQKLSRRFDVPGNVENPNDPKIGSGNFGTEGNQADYHQDVEDLSVSIEARTNRQDSHKESSFEKDPLNNLESSRSYIELPSTQIHPAQSDRYTNIGQAVRKTSHKIHNSLPEPRRPGYKSTHLSHTSAFEDVDDEISCALTPPRRPLSVISTNFARDQDSPQAPKAVDIFQWGVEMLREERDQVMSKDLTIRKYDKRIDDLTNKYSLANHRIQDSIEAKAEAERKVEKLIVGLRLTRASLERISEDHRNICTKFQELKGQDEKIASHFKEHQAQSQRREDEIRGHYSQLLREQATVYGKDLESLQEVEDTLRVELEARMRQLQEQKGMVEQATKHIEEEKTRYNELKNQLSAYESNVLEKLNASSNAFNDLAKSYESGQSSINDRLISVEKNNSESPISNNELDARFQAQVEAIRKDQDALGELNRQITELHITNEVQSKELDKSRAEANELQRALASKNEEILAAQSAANESTKITKDLQRLQDRNMKLEQAASALKKQLSERNDKAKIADQANTSLKDEVNMLTTKLQEQKPIHEASLIRVKKDLEELHAKEIADLTTQMSTQIQKQKDDLIKATGDRDLLSLQLSTATKNYEAELASVQLLREQVAAWKAERSDFESRAAAVFDQITPRGNECSDIAGSIRSLDARIDALKHAVQNASNNSPKPANKRSFEPNLQAVQQPSIAKRQKLQSARVQTGGLRSLSRSSIISGPSGLGKDHFEDDAMRIRSFAEIEGSNDEGQQEQPRSKEAVTRQKSATKTLSARRAVSYAALAPPHEISDETSRHFNNDNQDSHHTTSGIPSTSQKSGDSKTVPDKSQPANMESFSSPPRIHRRRERRSSMKLVSFDATGMRAQPQVSGPTRGSDQSARALPRRSLKRN